MDFGAGLIWCALLAAPDVAEVDQALRRVLEADEYQTILPPARREVVPVRPGRPVREPARGRNRPPEGRRAPATPRDPAPARSPGDLKPIAAALFWILVAVFAAAAAVWIAREVRARRLARAALGDEEAPAEGPAAPAAARVPDWERLALAGRHADAIHAILLAVLARIGSARAGLRPAWTSREILRLVRLEDGAHRALASLVSLVEVTRFGGAPAAEAEYQNALGFLGAIGGGPSS